MLTLISPVEAALIAAVISATTTLFACLVAAVFSFLMLRLIQKTNAFELLKHNVAVFAAPPVRNAFMVWLSLDVGSRRAVLLGKMPTTPRPDQYPADMAVHVRTVINLIDMQATAYLQGQCSRRILWPETFDALIAKNWLDVIIDCLDGIKGHQVEVHTLKAYRRLMLKGKPTLLAEWFGCFICARDLLWPFVLCLRIGARLGNRCEGVLQTVDSDSTTSFSRKHKGG